MNAQTQRFGVAKTGTIVTNFPAISLTANAETTTPVSGDVVLSGFNNISGSLTLTVQASSSSATNAIVRSVTGFYVVKSNATSTASGDINNLDSGNDEVLKFTFSNLAIRSNSNIYGYQPDLRITKVWLAYVDPTDSIAFYKDGRLLEKVESNKFTIINGSASLNGDDQVVLLKNPVSISNGTSFSIKPIVNASGGFTNIRVAGFTIEDINDDGHLYESDLTSVFRYTGLRPLETSGFSFTQSYIPSGSTWSLSFPETHVYNALLKYEDSENRNRSYELRIGKGGQIYSFKGAFGESVPPQWRDPNVPASYGGQESYAPWIDEVWQMVAIDISLNELPPDNYKYFIHQAGVYLKTPRQTTPFYSPLVASRFNEEEQSYTVVNWGQQAHTEDNLRAGFTSDILYYNKYTNRGRGVIQVDCMMYNFGKDTITQINVPWGGVRRSSLENFFVSQPDGTYINRNDKFGEVPSRIMMEDTGGWMGYSKSLIGASPALSMVHKNNPAIGNSLINQGYAGSPTSRRDYNVNAVVRNRYTNEFTFGKCLRFRYFYVLSSSIEGAKAIINGQSLSDYTVDEAITFSSTEAADINYDFHKIGEEIQYKKSSSAVLPLKAQPYKDSYPLFLVKSNQNRWQITTNLYHFSTLPYDGRTVDIKLLGFLNKKTEVTVKNDTLTRGANFTFPDGTVLRNIQSSTSYLSRLTSSKVGFDSLVINNLTIAATLPVSLISFTASKKDDNVLLSWSTSSELNNNYFKLSRSIDGLNFSLLSVLEASTDGNVKNTYYFSDLQPANGLNYYRLEQVDLDGSIRDLGIKVVNFSIVNSQKVVIYPNPAQKEVKVIFNKDFYNTAKLIDLQGKILQMKNIYIEDTEVVFDLKSLSWGHYLIHLDGKVEVVKKIFKE
nr:T9SS type A sorting domain-containing protein [Pedobacter glucosidilyticus]